MNENRIKQVLEIEKKAEELHSQAVSEAQQLPAQAEQEAQEIVNKARVDAEEQARQLVAKARAEDEVARILAGAEEKNRQMDTVAQGNFDRAVSYILDRVTGRE